MSRIDTRSIKTNADLDAALGPALSKLARGLRLDYMKRLPGRVEFHTSKPAFHLNDGSILRAYAVDLVSSEVLSEMSCGTGAQTTLADIAAQLDDKAVAPHNCAIFFVETYWNGRNHSWTLTCVSSNFAGRLTA